MDFVLRPVIEKSFKLPVVASVDSRFAKRRERDFQMNLIMGALMGVVLGFSIKNMLLGLLIGVLVSFTVKDEEEEH